MYRQKAEKILLIYPHQLFAQHPGFAQNPDRILLIEDPLFFGDGQRVLRFHKQKILLHRASMRSYFEVILSRQSVKAEYCQYKLEQPSTVHIDSYKVSELIFCDPVDHLLSQRIQQYTLGQGIRLSILPTPNFLDHDLDYFQSKQKLHLTDYYIQRRKKMSLLIDSRNKPLGGKWTFDSENRKKLPKNEILPEPIIFNEDNYTLEAKQYVENNFSANPGSISDFNYPINHSQASENLVWFLENSLAKFGDYQDAILTPNTHGNEQLFHSKLSAALNIGLLDPREIINSALQMEGLPLNSLEGFLRQIIGWREFVRGAYLSHGEMMRSANFFGHKNQLPAGFYTGKTGFAPVDDAILKTMNTAYAHHIERLMIIGNYMLLSKIHPEQVYNWFMEMYIDAYDWVMVPNVYGMSQFAAGPLMTTKPYFSGSNYVFKMSDYPSKPKPNWASRWDELFWQFVRDNRSYIQTNPRLSLLLKSKNANM